MKLYLLKRVDDENNDYDTYNELLIRETSPIKARALAQELDTDDKTNSWIDKTKTTCRIVKEDGPREIIITDFKAG